MPGEGVEAIDGVAPWPATVQVLHERLLAGQLVTRIFEGKAQVKVGVGYETTSMSLVTTTAGRRDPADSEFEDLTVGGAGCGTRSSAYSSSVVVRGRREAFS